MTDLDPNDFSSLLSLVDVLLRPTTTDGDAVTVREAGYLLAVYEKLLDR
ncbi:MULTISPECIES: hypothetical protein [Sorangium]